MKEKDVNSWEEFEEFLITDTTHRRPLTNQHAELFDPQFWQGIQESVENGFLPDITPYARDMCFNIHNSNK